ncbi:hypothetical protein BGZ60DRAFT_114476 [Tricladium varicosporioides]|nr:hypothetical protein BGZ60DRAFT_114476 [Hymenoscyphus varicosporioides]
MRFSIFLTCATLAVGINALALPKVTLEGENGIIVEDDGSTKIDGETGITVNSQGQTTNLGGSAGITITPDASKPATGAAKGNKTTGATGTETNANKPKGTGNTDGLIALLGALQGTQNAGAAKKNGTPPRQLPKPPTITMVLPDWLP